jgi:hypothetical protein
MIECTIDREIAHGNSSNGDRELPSPMPDPSSEREPFIAAPLEN